MEHLTSDGALFQSSGASHESCSISQVTDCCLTSDGSVVSQVMEHLMSDGVSCEQGNVSRVMGILVNDGASHE